LPVVAFDRTACADGILHKETGWIAPDGDVRSFCEGILWWRERSRKEDWLAIREKISAAAAVVYRRAAIVDAWQKLLSMQ
jgi:glycosyltransferase involved in cell wall biosynthesis